MELDRVEMEDGQSLADLYEKIGLRNFDAGFAVINGQVVHDAAHPLKDGDRVALFPPLAGG
ncbi:MAG TPA: MoaD/ThiS family protein [Bacillota bacterium]|nr:MoaD/ThiS family protein [Bacillota bacterium]